MAKSKLIIMDLILVFIIVVLLSQLRPDLVMIFFYFLLYPYLLITKRKEMIFYLLISSLVALVWVLFANDQYNYNQKMIKISGLNAFTLFTSATGLFIVSMFYSHVKNYLKTKNKLINFLFFTLFYWLSILAGETIAYHIFHIHNLATVAYAGLPICDCIHAPAWMQISYFALGPIYFLFCVLLGLKNPHHPKNKY